MISARYRYLVFADSPRDAGWVRLFNHFDTVEDAESAIVCQQDPLMVRSDDYRRLKIVKSIVFKPRRHERNDEFMATPAPNMDAQALAANCQ